jgi:cardiolipin synthase C
MANRNPATRFLLMLFTAIALLAGACSHAPLQHPERRASYAIEDPETTRLGTLFSDYVLAHPGESGFLLLDKGGDALLWRGALADSAEHTLDAQYYIWHDDTIGTLAAERLLRAAERGVRVRVLVDDFPLDAEPRHLALLNAHPNVEIRVYNPVDTLDTWRVIRALAVLSDFSRLNRRMHNKVFIADGSVAIIGGRNIGDEYFDTGAEQNFRDRDLMAVGPIVRNISNSFDTYWNSPWVRSVDALISDRPTAAERAVYYKELHAYATDSNHQPVHFIAELPEIKRRLNEVAEHLAWGRASLIFDIPGKNNDPDRLNAFGRSGALLTDLALRTKHEIVAETPYLLMMPGTLDVVDRLRARGVRIKLLTNSLASTDVLAIYAAYKEQRRELLDRGVELYEMRPRAASRRHLVKGWNLLEEKPEFSLHAKTVVFDRERVYVGSFNMDPRSTHLNTEIGLVVHSPELARRLLEVMANDFSPANSWRVSIDDDGQLQWEGTTNGKVVRHIRDDPYNGFFKSLKVFIYSILQFDPIL